MKQNQANEMQNENNTSEEDQVEISEEAKIAAEQSQNADPEVEAFYAESDQNAEADENEDEQASTDVPDLQAIRIKELEAELATMKDRALRALAEADNTRRRAEKERADTAKFAVSSFAKNLLPVADNLRRALEAIPEETRKGNETIENIVVGVEATERELLRAFDKAGIKPIEAMEKPFDPNFHEVLFEGQIEGAAPGSVIQVMETGYVINERLLRPARVGIAKRTGGSEKKVDQEV